MSGKKNKYHYDVKNCHYCTGTRNDDGTITFGSEVKREPGLMSMDMGAEGEVTKVRADGIDYLVLSSNNGYSGTLNFVKVSDQFRQDCLSEIADEKTGIQYEDADADPVPFALMGEFKGDAEGIRWIYYNCTASRPNQAGENKDNQKEPDTEELSVTASPLPVTINGEEKNIVRGGITKSQNEATFNEWFNKVILPGAEVTSSDSGAGTADSGTE